MQILYSKINATLLFFLIFIIYYSNLYNTALLLSHHLGGPMRQKHTCTHAGKVVALLCVTLLDADGERHKVLP